jgi:hypothetical protein
MHLVKQWQKTEAIMIEAANMPPFRGESTGQIRTRMIEIHMGNEPLEKLRRRHGGFLLSKWKITVGCKSR